MSEHIFLQGDLARALKKTRQDGTHLVWTGTGSTLKVRRKRWSSTKSGTVGSHPGIETMRFMARGQRINPRILFYACEHGLLLPEVPLLRCACPNKLCVLPAHMRPIGPPPAVTAAPAITPEILDLMAGMPEDEILARLRMPWLEPVPADLFDEPA